VLLLPVTKTTTLSQGSFIRHGVSREQLEGEIPLQIIAGSDTTATAVRGTMLYLMTTPHAYQCLQQEIDDAIAQGAISSPVKMEEGKQLEYLQVLHTAPITHVSSFQKRLC
jgi:cytochrome P450